MPGQPPERSAAGTMLEGAGLSSAGASRELQPGAPTPTHCPAGTAATQARLGTSSSLQELTVSKKPDPSFLE